MIIKIHKYSIIILIALLQGCNPFDTSDSIFLETGISDDGLLIYFWELHDYNEDSYPELFMEMHSKKSFGCSNHSIEYKKLKSDTNIEIRLLGIKKSPYCYGSGRAKAQIPFSDFEGIMKLAIREGNLRDRYVLNISREKVDITPVNKVFTETSYTRYYRKPENSFFLQCSTTESMTHLCDDFHNQMINEIEITPFDFPKDGRNPYQFGGERRPNDPVVSNSFYKYETDEDFHLAGELLIKYVHEVIGDSEINSLTITNWRNESYASWQIQRSPD